MRRVEVVGELDATFAWDGVDLYEEAALASGRTDPSGLRGAAATAAPAADGEGWQALRDPLGLNKLFWAVDDGDTLLFAARPWRLIERGCALDQIAAVPRGTVVDIGRSGEQAAQRSLVPERWAAGPATEADLDLDPVAAEIRDLLDRYLAAISARHRGAPAFVCLSGGLDSSGIAVLVAEHFPDAVAVSFDLSAPGRPESDDRRTAVRLAGDLGLPLLEATVSADELLGPLDTVLREGIDWRDFNVHAALVNAALAGAIADAVDRAGPPPLVFTGDLANEFLIDYAPERYRGDTYYSLPELEPVALRSLLIRGLDTCHREVGVFEAWGQRLVQPYAVAVDAYLRLPAAFLRQADRKERLCQLIFGRGIPEYVLTRPKARAQVGGANPEGGVLAACVDRGLDAAALRRRFAELHGNADERSLASFIRAGRYRARPPGDDQGQR